MSVTRRQFFALVGAGAAAALIPLPELAHAESMPAPTVAIKGQKGRAFRITEVQCTMFLDGDYTMHVEGREEDGWMQVAFDLRTKEFAHLRPDDLVYIDVPNLTAPAWPPPLDTSRGQMTGLQELTLTMPSLQEREVMDMWSYE